MSVEEQLKQEILSKYKSVRAFTTQFDIPYSTLDSVFKRGVTNAGVGNMIKVFNALDLDIESILSDELKHKNLKDAGKRFPGTSEAALGSDPTQMILSPDEQKIVTDYRSLNPQGQALVRQNIEVVVLSDKYKKSRDLPDMDKEA